MRYGLIHIGLSAKLHEGKKATKIAFKEKKQTNTQDTTLHFSPLKWKIYNTTNCNNSLGIQEQKGSQKSRSFSIFVLFKGKNLYKSQIKRKMLNYAT